MNAPVVPVASLPDHTQLPDSDGNFVKNFQEHPQSILLTDSALPVLQRLHPNGWFCIGQDCGIYWRMTDPPQRGAVSPDWFYVPDVPPVLGGRPRRSYVMWQEFIAPLVALEIVSGDGSEERDQTPWEGKFWIYERVLRIPFYGIFEADPGKVEVHHLVDGHYQQMSANERGHYPIAPLGMELGIWQGRYLNMDVPWLRWWDSQGNMLLTGDERVELVRREHEQARQRAEQLAARLRAMGVDPDAQ